MRTSEEQVPEAEIEYKHSRLIHAIEKIGFRRDTKRSDERHQWYVLKFPYNREACVLFEPKKDFKRGNAYRIGTVSIMTRPQAVLGWEYILDKIAHDTPHHVLLGYVKAMIAPETPIWRQEFPETFDIPECFKFALGEGNLVDCSWRNDICPSFANASVGDDGERLRIFVDAENPKDRESWDGRIAGHRFAIIFDGDVFYEGDDAEESLTLFAHLSPEVIAEAHILATTKARGKKEREAWRYAVEAYKQIQREKEQARLTAESVS